MRLIYDLLDCGHEILRRFQVRIENFRCGPDPTKMIRADVVGPQFQKFSRRINMTAVETLEVPAHEMAEQRSTGEGAGHIVAREQQPGPINFREHTLAVLRLAGKIKELQGNAFPDDFLAVREDPIDLERLMPEAREIVSRGILQHVDHVRHGPEFGSMTLFQKTDSAYM